MNKRHLGRKKEKKKNNYIIIVRKNINKTKSPLLLQ